MTKMTKGAYELVGVVEKEHIFTFTYPPLVHIPSDEAIEKGRMKVVTVEKSDEIQEMKDDIYHFLIRQSRIFKDICNALLVVLTFPFWIWSYKSKQ